MTATRRLDGATGGAGFAGMSPEEVELERKRAALVELELELADLELELATLRGELMTFQRAYMDRVGRLYAELDALNAQIAELASRRKPRDAAARQAAESAKSQAQESAQAVDDVAVGAGERRFEPSETLGKVYRDAARKLHPDLTTDEVERSRRKRVMAEVNEAYEQGDEARIRQILDGYRMSPDQVQGEDTAAQLIRAIRTIAMVEKRMAAIRDEIAAIGESDLSRLKSQVDEAAEAGRDLLAEMAMGLKERIREARQTLETLVEEGTAA